MRRISRETVIEGMVEHPAVRASRSELERLSDRELFRRANNARPNADEIVAAATGGEGDGIATNSFLTGARGESVLDGGSDGAQNGGEGSGGDEEFDFAGNSILSGPRGESTLDG